MNFTHRGKYFFLFLLSQFPFFNFLEKENAKTRLNLLCFGPKPQKTARPFSFRAHRPHPGRNLGLGRQCPARPRARLGRDLAHSLVAVRLHPTAARAHRRIKTSATVAAPLNPSAIRPSLSLSLRLTALSSPLSPAAADTERGA